MKTVAIPIEIREEIDKERGSKPITRMLKELADEFEEIGDLGEPKGVININMDDDTHRKLNHLKMYPTESLGSVIFRLIRTKRMKERLTYTSTSTFLK